MLHKNNDEEKNSSSKNTTALEDFPDEIAEMFEKHFNSAANTLRLALVNKNFYCLFKVKGKERNAAECVIHPTKNNVEQLKKLLKEFPELLRHKVTIKNRHGIEINGTVYQIALHEGDNELIDDVIKDEFKRLDKGEEIMADQRQAWFPEGWMKAEEETCANAYKAIDLVFTAFKKASDPGDVTELPNYPYTITIHHPGVKAALDAFRDAVDVLYQPTTNVVIDCGRDPIIRLLQQVINRYEENYDLLGGYDTPRNNALMRAVYGYCQRFAPINFMQAFAQGIYYIIESKEKLRRSFEYRNWAGRFILPVDSDPLYRLGYEYCEAGDGWGGRGVVWFMGGPGLVLGVQNFLSIKNSCCSTVVRYATPNPR